jgi:gamma-glutamyl-gamma-aminobutyrate hydrolase PuuD
MEKYWIPTGDWHISTGYAHAHRLMQSFGLIEGDETDYDVLVLPGGADIGVRPNRDEFEFKALEDARKNGKQVFGICRGMQVMLYVTGVPIIDHIPDEENVIEHRTLTGDWKGQSGWHRTKAGLLVNSRHHQGARGDVGHWEVLDESEDGIIEAVRTKCQFGVQWHPEHPEMIGTPALQWLEVQLKKNGII